MTVRFYTKEYGCICGYYGICKITYKAGKLYLINEYGFVDVWSRFSYDYFTVDWRG